MIKAFFLVFIQVTYSVKFKSHADYVNEIYRLKLIAEVTAREAFPVVEREGCSLQEAKAEMKKIIDAEKNTLITIKEMLDSMKDFMAKREVKKDKKARYKRGYRKVCEILADIVELEASPDFKYKLARKIMIKINISKHQSFLMEALDYEYWYNEMSLVLLQLNEHSKEYKT